jgi:hypothetical protein
MCSWRSVQPATRDHLVDADLSAAQRSRIWSGVPIAPRGRRPVSSRQQLASLRGDLRSTEEVRFLELLPDVRRRPVVAMT